MGRVKSQISKVKNNILTTLLTRGVAEVIDLNHLTRQLKSGKQLRVKFGIDPTNASIHLGHAVPLRKLRDFQKIGHQAVIIIGDWTAQIGDPSGRDKTRSALTRQKALSNARQYTDQLFKIIDRSLTEIRWQSEWYDKFKIESFFEIASRLSAHELLDHETFQKRLTQHWPMTVAELMYPILQGYDSVVVKADVELGAVEQKFNLLMGRKLQKLFNRPEQDIIMLSYLTGLDGKAKMSKSLGNTINLLDSPGDVYGKVMSIPDSLIVEYFTLATDLTDKGLAVVKKEVTSNPRNAKQHLAFLITEILHDSLAAQLAQETFDRVHRQKKAPDDIIGISVEKNMPVDELVSSSGLIESRSQARRVIEQGGVRIDGRVYRDWRAVVSVRDGSILQIGKRKFVKLIVAK